MGAEKARLRHHLVRPVGSRLAVSLCVAVGFLLLSAGTALGISGYGGGQPAVRAQYPDAAGLSPRGPKPMISSLGDAMRVMRAIDRDPKAAARFRGMQRQVRHTVIGSIASVPALDARQSGSLALLLLGTAVLAAAAVIRSRRGLARTE